MTALRAAAVVLVCAIALSAGPAPHLHAKRALRLGAPTAVAGDLDTLLVRLRPQGSLSTMSGLQLVRTVPQLHQAVVRVRRGSELAAARRLQADPAVESVQRDVAFRSDQLNLLQNDVAFPQQWALPVMQVPYAWELTQGAGAIVGVIDTGVDLTHPDLAAHLLGIGCDIVADGACPADGHGTPPQDVDGHGTHLAGIAAAVAGNQIGIAGIAYGASILPVRVYTGTTGRESDFIAGLVWAVDHGANVLNFSFSEACGGTESVALHDALSYAWNRGVVLVASAGNDAGCSDRVYPAADPLVLSVTATDPNDAPLANVSSGPWVKLAAPGDRILSTWTHSQYLVASGTSMAAAQVSGVAALLMSVAGASNALVASWLIATCDVPPNWDASHGVGRINAYRAVTLAARGIDPHNSSTVPVRSHLVRGWNNVVYAGATRRPDVALASLGTKYGSVYSWDTFRSKWTVYLPQQPAASDLDLLQEQGAYWIFMRDDADLLATPSGDDPPRVRTLPAGWNNLALPAGSPAAAIQLFTNPPASIFAWDALRGEWLGYFSRPGAPSDLTALQANTAYWLYLRSAQTWRLSP